MTCGVRAMKDSCGIGTNLHERRRGATQPGDVLTAPDGLIHSCSHGARSNRWAWTGARLFSSLLDPRDDRWTLFLRLKSLAAAVRTTTARSSLAKPGALTSARRRGS